jgi:hypothetical protein
MNFLYPTDIFPFTDNVQRDEELGLEDGILKRISNTPEAMPRIFYTNSSYEYWGRAASLINTTVDGKTDISVPDSVRIYHFAGTQHGAASFPPQQGIGQQRSNSLDYHWGMRALLMAMHRWVDTEAEPPPSRHGRVADGTLVSPQNLKWPKIPGAPYTSRLHKAWRVDYGDRFYSEGIVDKQPPGLGSAFPIKVPQVDEDGNELAGIEMPALAVPVATFAGWNLFREGAGPTDELSSMQGSYIPFPATKEKRQQSGDPRLSLEERYSNRESYLRRVAYEAVKRARSGYLLEEDIPETVEAAARNWDFVTSLAGAGTGQ